MTPGQLLGSCWLIWGITIQTSYVEGRWHQNWVYTSSKLFFADGQGNQWETEFVYSSGRYLETKKDILMGYKRWNDWYTIYTLYIGEQKPFWQILAEGHFWPCFSRPMSVEGDKMRSVIKNMRCHKKVYLPQVDLLGVVDPQMYGLIPLNHFEDKILCI